MQEMNTEIYLKKKDVRRDYGRNRYHDYSEEKKKKNKEIPKKVSWS